MAPQAACVHEGGGVERRAAHHERERQRRQREAAGGTTEPAAEEAMDVEAVSAADVLAGVEESGPFITILRYTCVRAHYFGGIETAEP